MHSLVMEMPVLVDGSLQQKVVEITTFHENQDRLRYICLLIGYALSSTVRSTCLNRSGSFWLRMETGSPRLRLLQEAFNVVLLDVIKLGLVMTNVCGVCCASFCSGSCTLPSYSSLIQWAS